MAAALVGVDGRTWRKWTASDDADNLRAMPWSAWALIRILTGEATPESIRSEADQASNPLPTPFHRDFVGEGGEVLEITVGSDLMAAAWCNGKRTAKVHLTADEYAAIKDAKDANTAFAIIDRIVTE